MRLVKQTILYFKEGNSDKTYEIDLCELGFDRYTVNFRYGRRGAQLKEGSKTPVPVSLTEAEKIFDAVETEKMQKGYTTNPEAVSTIAAKAVFTLQNLPPVSLDWQSLPPGKEKAILQRLHNAVTKQPASNRTKWKLSRVVWKAGAAQLKDAVPYLTHLFNQQESMLQYSCCWALARSGNPSAIPALQQIFTAKPSKLLSQLAGAGLLKLLEGLERDQHIQHFHNSLPDSFKAIIDRRQETELDKLVQERISEVEPSYPWIEKLYLLSFDKKWIRPVVKNLLQRIELKAGYFKHIRTIYKWAEMLNDFEVLGLLSSRFEREPQQYTHFLSAAERKKKNTYIPLLEDYVKLSVEQAKTTTKLAYSNKTRNYLHRRTLKNLIATGKANNTDYVKLATALLISYTKNLDEKEAYTEYTYSWINNRYQRIELRFPANAQAVYLHQILNGNNAAMKLVSGNRYQFITEAVRTAKSPDEQSSGIVQFITRLFRRNKPAAQFPATPPIPPVSEKDAAIPFLHLWNQMPQAYIQLLIDAELEQVHQFAAHQLAQHPRYAELIQKIDVSTAIRLIGSAFALPAEFGFNLVKARFPQGSKDINLLLALLNCPIDNARATARRWVEAEPNDFITAADFMIPVLFSIQDDTRNWGKDLPKNKFLPDATKELLAVKAIAYLVACKEGTAPPGMVLKDGTDYLLDLCQHQLAQVSSGVLADLLQHPVPEILLFGLQVLKLQQKDTSADQLPETFITELIQHGYEPVRMEGMKLVNKLSVPALKKIEKTLLAACLSVYGDIRRSVRPALQKLAAADPDFGNEAVSALLPLLLRKEKSEGIHQDISELLCSELSTYLPNANQETALKLLYAKYPAAQQTGLHLLEKYSQPATLSIAQVVQMGSHENLYVREWCWAFFEKEAARITFEKESAVALLNSKWKDSREFARQYFRRIFRTNDWDPDLLISLADSTNEETEAYARELITTHFQSENGEQYLLQLSQHPREKMQLFVTNYLENYAANDLSKIRELEFYFRSVLTRVNKGRIAKNRVLNFLTREGLQSAEAAAFVAAIVTDVSATAAVEDRARCIELLTRLQAIYAIETPLKVIPLTEKTATP